MNDPSTQAESFRGLRVAAFESRRAEELAKLIRTYGGEPFVSPALREVPLAENPKAVEFGQRLVLGQIDVVIFLTGVGCRMLIEFLESHLPRQRLLDSIADVVTIARGPKPVAALKQLGLVPTYQIPEPNTWREILAFLDEQFSVVNLQVAIQEYGEPNLGLIAGLEARGAYVTSIPVYTWGLPEETGPLRRNIQAIAAGDRDVLLFTSAPQVQHLLAVAQDEGLLPELRRQIPRMVLASIGPSTSEALRRHGFSVDIEAQRSKLGSFVREIAGQVQDVRQRRQGRSAAESSTSEGRSPNQAWYDREFLRACRREPVRRVPVWFWQQQPGPLPSYPEKRPELSWSELLRRPAICAELLAEVSELLELDAVAALTDLNAPLAAMGMPLETPGDGGSIVTTPLREPSCIDRLKELEDLTPLTWLTDVIQHSRVVLRPEIPLVGLIQGPFSLASQAIEGNHPEGRLSKQWMFRDEHAWHELMQRITRGLIRWARAQIESGVQAILCIDPRAGCLSPDDYRIFVLPHSAEFVACMPPGVPTLWLSQGNPQLLTHVAAANPSVVALDWRIRLDEAWKRVGYHRAVQGNLDPALLQGTASELSRQARHVLRQGAGRPGYIFSLGGSIPQEAPWEHLQRLVQEVRAFEPT